MCALALVSAVVQASTARAAAAGGQSPDAARAGAPASPVDRDVDSFDVYLDRSAGDRVDDEPRGGAFLIGATASLTASSSSSLSFGFVGFVQVPFDRLAQDRRLTLLPTAIADRKSVAPARAAAPSSRTPPATPAPPVDRKSRPAPAPSSPAPSDHALPAPVDAALDSVIDPAPEPSPPASLLTPELARGAVRAACKVAKLDEADARLDSLASRAKTSALLPELRLRATRAIDESESLAPTEYDPSRRTATGSSTTWLEARATFRLDRLVFAEEEIAVERQRMARASERTKLVTKVLELLDTWQRARFTEADPEAKLEAKARASLSAIAAEASLDVLTNGWFSKAIDANSRAATPSSSPAKAAPGAAPSPRTAPDPPDASASK